MFKVKDTFGDVHVVYAVDRRNSGTYFLIYNGYHWKWVDSTYYTPIEY